MPDYRRRPTLAYCVPTGFRQRGREQRMRAPHPAVQNADRTPRLAGSINRLRSSSLRAHCSAPPSPHGKGVVSLAHLSSDITSLGATRRSSVTVSDRASTTSRSGKCALHTREVRYQAHEPRSKVSCRSSRGAYTFVADETISRKARRRSWPSDDRGSRMH